MFLTVIYSITTKTRVTCTLIASYLNPIEALNFFKALSRLFNLFINLNVSVNDLIGHTARLSSPEFYSDDRGFEPRASLSFL